MSSSPGRFHAHLLDLWEEADAGLIGGGDWDELALDSLRQPAADSLLLEPAA